MDLDYSEIWADAMNEDASAIVLIGTPSITMRVLDLSVEHQREMRCVGVEGIHERRVIRLVSLSSTRSRPSVR